MDICDLQKMNWKVFRNEKKIKQKSEEKEKYEILTTITNKGHYILNHELQAN